MAFVYWPPGSAGDLILLANMLLRVSGTVRQGFAFVTTAEITEGVVTSIVLGCVVGTG